MTDTPSRSAPDHDVLDEAAGVFQLLSAPGRLHLLWLLFNNEVDVSTLVSAVGGTKAGISQHLTKLRLAGWINRRRDGLRILYKWSTRTSSPWSTRGSNTSCTNEPHQHRHQWDPCLKPGRRERQVLGRSKKSFGWELKVSSTRQP